MIDKRTISGTTHKLLERKQIPQVNKSAPNEESSTLDTTVDDWRTEIEKLETEGDPGFTVEELAQELDCATTTARRRAHALVKRGICVQGRGIRRAKDGRIKRLPVFQLIKKAGK